ncbi:MAG: VPLPA-CTERM sorting domain-containing protein [Sulfitobacter sp.]
MKNKAFLSGTAMALALLVCAPAQAATCTTLGAVITCGEVNSDPVASPDNGVSVVIEGGASVLSADRDATAVALTGNNVTVQNAGTITQSDTRNNGYAITGTGAGLTVDNVGTIESGDRAIEMLSGSGLRVLNHTGAAITARRQTIRSLEGVTGAYVENDGTISSADGRALQLRGNGATVINRGDLIGGEEVVEARGDFTLENYGNIYLNDPLIEDEDAVQFASGQVDNYGSITGSDDGIDMDEGVVVNHVGGIIRSTALDTNPNSGIDIDEVFDDGITERANGLVKIVNMGLIEGPTAIGTDDAATNEIQVFNTGTLLGRGGTAIRLAGGQGNSELHLAGASQVIGDVLFGGGDDLVSIGTITSGLLANGIFSGGLGVNSVLFDGFDLMDITSFMVDGNEVALSFLSSGDILTGTFFDFDTWTVGNINYSTAALFAAVSPSQVPLPAGLPLLLACLGALGLARRRRC